MLWRSSAVIVAVLVLSLQQVLFCYSLYRYEKYLSPWKTGFHPNRFSFASAMSKIDHSFLIKSKVKWLIPPLALLAVANVRNKYTPLNKQPISFSTPFFQGWLIRTVDTNRNISSILIAGSFSPKKTKDYVENYIYCAISNNDRTTIHQELLPGSDVTITTPKSQFSILSRTTPLDIKWNSRKYGYFHFTDDNCQVSFRFPSFNVSLTADKRIPWSGFRSTINPILPYPSFSGPEGWLEYTHLLPCHYFIYSVGSSTNYSFQLEGQKQLDGTGYSHIEGNHGTFFPNGWVWSEGIGEANEYSFSLVIGRFCIGGLTPVNTCIYLRRRNGKVAVIRSIDNDQVQYRLDGIAKTVEIKSISKLKGMSMNITIKALDRDSFHQVYVPTAQGFSNHPGCQETYTAVAKIHYAGKDMKESEYYQIPLTALEFGGSFIDQIV